MERPLPPFWREGISSTGRVYYHHLRSKATQWKRPRWDEEDISSEADEEEKEEEKEEEDQEEEEEAVAVSEAEGENAENAAAARSGDRIGGSDGEAAQHEEQSNGDENRGDARSGGGVALPDSGRQRAYSNADLVRNAESLVRLETEAEMSAKRERQTALVRVMSKFNVSDLPSPDECMRALLHSDFNVDAAVASIKAEKGI